MNIRSRHSSPVFIIGCPRSGTSVLSHALAAHPEFWTSNESDFLIPFCEGGLIKKAHQLSWDHPESGWARRCDVSYSEFAAYFGYGIDQLFLSRSEGKRWIDQTPGYTMVVEHLAMMFPRARFLHILRDGRAVVNSMIHSGFDKLGMNISWAADFTQACKAWVVHVDKARAFHEANAGKCLEVVYENLSADPESAFGTIFDFLDVEYSPQSAFYVKNIRINSSYDKGFGSVVKRKKKDEKRPSGEQLWAKWDNEKQQCFAEEAAATMRRMGYWRDENAGEMLANR